MRSEEIQELHDQIWKEIFERQEIALQLAKSNLPVASSSRGDNLISGQYAETVLDSDEEQLLRKKHL